MKRTTLATLFALLLITIFSACQKSITADLSSGNNINPLIKDTTKAITPADTVQAAPPVAYPKTAVTGCSGAPSYGDSIIFTQPASADYIVSPVNHPDTGTYFAWPTGMIIDKNTGAINVSKSEGGLRYSIGYVKKGTADTCLQTLILAGISYEDSLYVLSDDARYAKPYFNADPNLPSICGSNNGTNSCAFDVNGQAASQQVIVDKNSGFIDLKNTANRAFGLLPLNGTTVRTTIAYKLNDNSNMALQKITVDLVYYNKKSDVPADLLAVVADKLNKIVNQVLLINLLGSSSQQTVHGNPRPPIIIVTRSSF